MKKLYIAAPFFNEAQLALVKQVETTIRLTTGLEYYSPRHDGVLKDMNPEQRAAAGPNLFKLNVKMIRHCDAVLALKDFSDTGTTWETGFAYGIEKPVFAFRSDPTQPLNIMVLQCLNAVAYGYTNLVQMLHSYANDQPLDPWAVGVELKETF